ncbi:MAG TPA: hypothetical protein VFR11_16305 [Micromonosporaceae bacterium]|nr:hypothetical protein [Micromonosporaceae bacterium]
MATLRDILQRFRPSGAPGAAGAAAVPADRRARAEAELEPVFAALAPTVARCAEIRRVGAALAAGHTARATQHADAILADATRAESGERADAGARVRASLAAEFAAIDAAAARESDQVRRHADAVMSQLVDRAVERFRGCIADLDRNAAGDRTAQR